MIIPSKIHSSGRMPRSLPLELWPTADRDAWNAALQPAMRLKRGGRAAHLKPVTRDDHVRIYGNFLGFLSRHGLLEMDGPAAANVTPSNVDAYLGDLKARVNSVTVHGSICKLRRAARYMNPQLDLDWLLEIAKDLAFVMRPRSKFGRLVTSDVLVANGLTLMREAEDSKAMTARARACQFRNGLMVALLALCPIRRKNFAALEIDRTFVEINGTWWVNLSCDETKEGRPDERPVPELLTSAVNRYLEKHRPVLARSENPPAVLWLSGNDGSPITDKQIANVIRATTLATVGIKVSPHMFRTCAASTFTSGGGNNPHLASALLHHADQRVTDEYYNRANSMQAAERYRRIIRQYGKEEEGSKAKSQPRS